MKTFSRVVVCAILFGCLVDAEAAGPAKKKAPPTKSLYESIYGSYKPDFLGKPLKETKRGPGPEEMKLSTEKSFYTLSLLPESSRAYALIKAAEKKASEGAYNEAVEVLQKVIEQYPDELYRVSPHGVFVPITQYCQLKILGFPKASLEHYRTKYDARAAEAFKLARQNNSLEGLAFIRDFMLATSYGARAMLVLGDAALDRGHYLEAMEYYTMVQKHFPDDDARTPELNLKIAYCRKSLSDQGDSGKARKPAASALSPEDLKALREFVKTARREKPGTFTQMSSAPHVAASDYMLMPPSKDPLGLKPPVWETALPASRRDVYVYSNPVVTRNSVVYRHKNIVYCRSILNGRLRWENDMGGRVLWQNAKAWQYQHEDVLAQDGMVFTTMYQAGANLVALDEITGQLRWAYGPMAATTREEVNMRFLAAPAGGPMTIYAGYIQDNIEGSSHTDTEYGVIAFESTTGRVRWRQRLSRLRPGLFTVSWSQGKRNRIRSFSSPPLYYQGTVYYCTNAGTMAALDALSGRIKWIMRYPYYTHPTAIHDATHGTGGVVKPWYDQRPVMVGEDLYMLPIDSKFMYKLDRRTGRVSWTTLKTDGATYFMGPLPGGKLLMVNSGRSGRTDKNGPSMLLDPRTGKAVGRLPDPVGREPQPVVKLRFSMGGTGKPAHFDCLAHDDANFQIPARPFLSSSGQLLVGGHTRWGYRIWGYASNFGVYSLKEKGRPVTERRRYFSPELLHVTAAAIKTMPRYLAYLAQRKQDSRTKATIKLAKSVEADYPPENKHPFFLPFSLTTFKRYGTTFELRFGPRSVAMLYDTEAVQKALAGKKDAEHLFGAAEVAIREGRMSQAAELMQQCLASLPSEDIDFRTLINQQLYQVHKHLARGAVRSGTTRKELDQCLGMGRTATSLSDEIEMRFAIADAYERTRDYRNAGLQLQSLVTTYAGYGYPVSSLMSVDLKRLTETSGSILRRGGRFVEGVSHTAVLKEAAGLLAAAVPVYFGALSPLEKDLTVRADEWATMRLNRLRTLSKEFAADLEKMAKTKLAKRSPEEQRARLLEFPGTRAGQEALEALLAAADRNGAGNEASFDVAAKRRRSLWALADAARIGGLSLPKAYLPRLLAPVSGGKETPLASSLKERDKDMEEARGTAWLLLERRGDRTVNPHLAFLGGRVKKKFDNKFVLHCLDLATDKVTWKAQEKRANTWFEEIRLQGKGDEPGFSEAFVHDDIVVVHGLFDVLAFALKDGRLRWRYKVPFAFEIKSAVKSGDLLVLSGEKETVALYLGTKDPRGEVAWQQPEKGDLYGAPYFYKDRLVSLRSMPFNLTTRYRSTGRLIGRLSLPDLSLEKEHPLLEAKGPRALPVASDGNRLVVTDEEYTIMLNVERMSVVWKRLIDSNDQTRRPPMRFALKGDYLAVIKRDFDAKTIYMLSSKTGQVLWHTDPKNRRSVRPIHSMVIQGDKLYGIRPHAGEGYYFVGMDCKTGKSLFKPNEQRDYGAEPDVRLRPSIYGSGMVVELKDQQDFELKAFDNKSGKLLHMMQVKASGSFGEHGRASATVQNGTLMLMGGHDLVLAGGKK